MFYPFQVLSSWIIMFEDIPFTALGRDSAIFPFTARSRIFIEATQAIHPIISLCTHVLKAV